ncbi:MAG: leucine-rich repeat protein [Peptostreptococcus sp.]|uniref:leucine-rich repeat protein n=1 Tax=Peptostreptococcus sp. TaxID=1262 RepID=UPI002FC845D9
MSKKISKVLMSAIIATSVMFPGQIAMADQTVDSKLESNSKQEKRNIVELNKSDIVMKGDSWVALTEQGKKKFTNTASIKLPSNLGVKKISIKISEENIPLPHELIIGEGVEEIDAFAFYVNPINTPDISNLELPNSLKKIGKSAFENNSIFELKLPSQLESVGEEAFLGNAINKLTIPDSMKSISKYAFAENSISELNFSNNLESIEEGAFSSNKLKEVDFPEGLKSIGSSAFFRNQIEKISFPKSIETIEAAAFRENRLKDVSVIPKGEKIDKNTVASYQSITMFTIDNKIPLYKLKDVNGDTPNEVRVSEHSIESGHSLADDLIKNSDGSYSVKEGKTVEIIVSSPHKYTDNFGKIVPSTEWHATVSNSTPTPKIETVIKNGKDADGAINPLKQSFELRVVPGDEDKPFKNGDVIVFEENAEYVYVVGKNTVSKTINTAKMMGRKNEAKVVKNSVEEDLNPRLNDDGSVSFTMDNIFRRNDFISVSAKQGNAPYSSWEMKGIDEEVSEERFAKRLSGNNRFETAIEVSKNMYDKSDSVIIANHEKYQDILTASPLAVELKAPILYTDSKAISANTQKEIERLGAKNIYINGGKNSVSKDIENKLKENGYNVVRFDGKDRYETAALIGEKIRENGNKNTVEIASGENYPDALSISSLAMKENAPILLTKKDNLTKNTEKALSNWKVKNVNIAGGESSVSKDVENTLKTGNSKHDSKVNINPVENLKRFAGKDRYETSAKVLDSLLNDYPMTVLASGENFADALVAAPLAGSLNSPVALVRKNAIPNTVYNVWKKDHRNDFVIVGGEKSISNQLIYDFYEVKAK